MHCCSLQLFGFNVHVNGLENLFLCLKFTINVFNTSNCVLLKQKKILGLFTPRNGYYISFLVTSGYIAVETLHYSYHYQNGKVIFLNFFFLIARVICCIYNARLYNYKGFFFFFTFKWKNILNRTKLVKFWKDQQLFSTLTLLMLWYRGGASGHTVGSYGLII